MAQNLDCFPRQPAVLVGYSDYDIEGGDPRPPFLSILVTREPMSDTLGVSYIEAGPVLITQDVDPRLIRGALETGGLNGNG